MKGQNWAKRVWSAMRGDVPTVAVSDLPSAAPLMRHGLWDGEKFPGGYGATQLLEPDYWVLRQRSAELFATNLYARGLLRRLLTNELAAGLSMEAAPLERVLGREAGALDDWTEDVEASFELWGKTPALCDHRGERTFGALQAQARAEALIAGDVLVVLRTDPRTRLPRVQLVCGERVQTPLGEDGRRSRRIVHGVELDAAGRHRAFWVRQDDGTSRRLPAEVGGRRAAWLLYGVERRLDQVRGEPFLSLMLQSFKELDRYRDSTVRKAVISSFLAVYLQREQPTAGRGFLGGPAQRKGSTSAEVESPQGRPSRELMPGLILQDLEPGEEPKAFPTSSDESFGEFERAILATLAWAMEVPPSILVLSFSSNYASSQAELNEFKLYLQRFRSGFADEFCAPVYREWLVAEALSERIAQPAILEAWRSDDPYQWAAWSHAAFAGAVKPVTDIWKTMKAMEIALDRGLVSHQLAARELFGRKWSQTIKQQKVERELAAEAGVPLGVQQQATPPEEGEAQDERDEEGEGEEENALAN